MSNLYSWIDLLPPLLVLGCAALTHRVLAALTLGIFSASLIVAKGGIITATIHALTTMLHVVCDSERLYLFAFLATLGTIIELMAHAGGLTAYAKFAHRFIHSKRDAETSSLLLSCLFFLDDYLNSLMTGSSVQTITDSYRVPRVKLAFLLNAMSSSLCPLIPVTSWAALILGQFALSNISDHAGSNPLIYADPLFLYLTTIPFIFYSFFIIISAFVIVRAQLSFGAMKKQEILATTTGNLFGGKLPPPQRTISTEEGSLSIFFFPIVAFIIAVSFFIVWTGDSSLFGGENSFIESLKNAQATLSLLLASLVSLAVLLLILKKHKKCSFKKIIYATRDGIFLMRNSLMVLLLAFTFSAIITHDLQTGPYLAQLISSSLPIELLPLIIFLLATLFTASTGSSWGSMLLLMPFVIKTLATLAPQVAQLTATNIPLLMPSLGAVIAGSVAGAHFSPITDATVVSAMSAGANHLDHVKTMIGYALPSLIGSSVAFLVIGLCAPYGIWTSYGIAAISGLFVTLAILFIRSRWARKVINS